MLHSKSNNTSTVTGRHSKTAFTQHAAFNQRLVAQPAARIHWQPRRIENTTTIHSEKPGASAKLVGVLPTTLTPSSEREKSIIY